MQTRCPNPRCRHAFDLPDDRAGKNGPCPRCGQVITFRPLEILEKLERQQAFLNGRPAQDAEARPDTGLYALLEDIRSLYNVGSIFRTADGAGFSRLYLCGITGCPPRKEIAKTSLGSEAHLAWSYAAGVLEVLPGLRAQGAMLVGLERTEASTPLAEALAGGALRRPLCLLMGNEVAGLSPEALDACDTVCHLPMRGLKTSLNVAVAFGVGAYRVAEALLPERPAPP